MKLQITTDYAIRTIGYLAQHNYQLLTAKKMADELGITYYYFNKIAARLKRAGFIESIQGPVGGYRLAKNAADITLYDIVEAMEGNIYINRCLEEDGFCSRNAVHSCPVHKILESVQNEIIASLRSKRMSEIWKYKE